MSSRDEELIDYEDENDVTNGAPVPAQNGAATTVAPSAGGADGDKDKKNYTGIHSTGFRLEFYVALTITLNLYGLSMIGTFC